jgi:hypothetical protein
MARNLFENIAYGDYFEYDGCKYTYMKPITIKDADGNESVKGVWNVEPLENKLKVNEPLGGGGWGWYQPSLAYGSNSIEWDLDTIISYIKAQKMWYWRICHKYSDQYNIGYSPWNDAWWYNGSQTATDYDIKCLGYYNTLLDYLCELKNLKNQDSPKEYTENG